MKSLQKEQNSTNLLLWPPTAGINLQSPQSDSTPWTLTLRKRTLKRTNSCPDCHEIEEIVAAKNKPIIEESKPKDSTEEKTDDKFRGINDEEPNIAENSEIFSII